MSNYLLNQKTYWDSEWAGIFQKYQQDRRFAYYLRSILDKDDNKIIELGAGSFRDMQQLNEWGIDCYGSDFSETAVDLAIEMYPKLAHKIINANAFELPFEDKTFDLSYHNGFWVCFEDQEIAKLLKEQVRVTKNTVVVCVHNAHNLQFKAYFDKLKQKDSLYSCRFFDVHHISELMLSSCKKVNIIPVGKGKKLYEDYLINLGLGDKESLQKCWDYHNMDLLEQSERLLCIGEI